MDQALVDVINATAPKDSDERDSWESAIAIIDEQKGEVEVRTPDGPKRHVLKPLHELFGKGCGITPSDLPQGPFLPLLMRIEESIVVYYRNHPGLTDGHVALVLSRLALKPGCDPGDDVLCRRIQLDLRLLLSLNNYSRQEVRWALHKIERSVRRHTSIDGPHGYLDFISGFLPH
jgi:hypothetical protein